MAHFEIKDLTFSYASAKGKHSLENVSLSIEQGEFVTLCGKSGSGKSTLLRQLKTVLTPNGKRTGEILFRGVPLKEVSDRDQSEKIGFVMQNPDDQIVASLVENDVAFGPENLGIENPELRQRVEESLAKVGLAGSGKRETAALSGGQKQRVAIAGVLAMHPSILIFDEASAMLDPRGRRGLMRVCKELHEQGMTVIMITHFMEEAAEADRVIVLNDGHCVLDGTPDEVLTQDHILRDLNLDVPFATHMSRLLQDRGINVGTHIETATLKEELCRSLSNR